MAEIGMAVLVVYIIACTINLIVNFKEITK